MNNFGTGLMWVVKIGFVIVLAMAIMHALPVVGAVLLSLLTVLVPVALFVGAIWGIGWLIKQHRKGGGHV